MWKVRLLAVFVVASILGLLWNSRIEKKCVSNNMSSQEFLLQQNYKTKLDIVEFLKDEWNIWIDNISMNCFNDYNEKNQTLLLTALTRYPLPSVWSKLIHNHVAYAKKHGMAYCVVTGTSFRDLSNLQRTSHWLRYALTHHFLHFFPWVVWMDIDMVFVHFDVSLQAEYIEKIKDKHNISLILSADTFEIVNSCFYAVRSDPISFSYLVTLYNDYKEAIQHPYVDNQAMILHLHQHRDWFLPWPQYGAHGTIIPYNDWHAMLCITRAGNPGHLLIDPEPRALMWHWAGTAQKYIWMERFLEHHPYLETQSPKVFQCVW